MTDTQTSDNSHGIPEMGDAQSNLSLQEFACIVANHYRKEDDKHILTIGDWLPAPTHDQTATFRGTIRVTVGDFRRWSRGHVMGNILRDRAIDITRRLFIGYAVLEDLCDFYCISQDRRVVPDISDVSFGDALEATEIISNDPVIGHSSEGNQICISTIPRKQVPHWYALIAQHPGRSHPFSDGEQAQ